MKKFNLLLTWLLLVSFSAKSQLKAGFDPLEYEELLGIFSYGLPDSLRGEIPLPKNFKKNYESEVVGLENKWTLWLNEEEKILAIIIRGTVSNQTSWLANFYGAMIPAKGTMKLRDDYSFNYDFASDPNAAVHVGWTVATSALYETIQPRVDSLLSAGYRDILVAGHSQGGAISYLVGSHLRNTYEKNEPNSDIRIKTYASAAPKPGNLFFAYEYEAKNQGGWAFNVTNSQDWVPQVPFSIQTVNDFSETNPFSDISGFIKGQKFPKNLIFKKVYNKLDKPTEKAKKNFQKYLGKYAGKQVELILPEYQEPVFFDSNHYVRAGNFVVLLADENYHKYFPDDPEKIFKHHMFIPYHFLLKKQFLD